LLDATDLLLDHLQKVALALCALVATRALQAALNVAALALVILKVVTLDALSAAEVAAGTLNTIA